MYYNDYFPSHTWAEMKCMRCESCLKTLKMQFDVLACEIMLNQQNSVCWTDIRYWPSPREHFPASTLTFPVWRETPSLGFQRQRYVNTVFIAISATIWQKLTGKINSSRTVWLKVDHNMLLLFSLVEVTQGGTADPQHHRGQLPPAGSPPQLSRAEQGNHSNLFSTSALLQVRIILCHFHIKTNSLNLLPVFMALSQDYVDSLKGLCYDGMEGLLYLSLYSFLSALAFTAILCSLPGAWRSFHRLGELHRSSQSNIPSAVILRLHSCHSLFWWQC